jgi:hypothetical protein
MHMYHLLIEMSFMEINKENLMHWIRTNRTNERLTDHVFQVTPFGYPIKLITENNKNRVMSDEIRVKCCHVSFICNRKQLTVWE